MPEATTRREPARILFLHTTSEIGGSDVSLGRLVERLDRTRFDPVVVLPADGPLVPRLRAAGATVHVMPSLWKLTSRRGRPFLGLFALHFPLAVRALARLVRRERIALVHTNTIHNWYGGAAAARTRVPHVWHIREIVWQSRMLRRLEVGLVRRWSSRIVAISDAVAAMFGPCDKVVTIPNGTELDRFAPGSDDAVREELGAGPGQVLFGIVCRLDAWKGVDVFLEAAARIAREQPRARFAVVGGPVIGQEDYAEALQRQTETLGIRDRVRFTGWRYPPGDMPRVHRALDVLVLASVEPEPFGLVLIEAMATGKPVVATRPGGPGEIVEDGITGYLVPPRDPAALAAAMQSFLEDPAAAERMGHAGRARALARYDADRYVRDVEAVYDELLAEGAR